jgi:hypothetical protein
MVKAKKATAPAPQDQNIVSCLFSKRHVKIEKTASDDDETQEPPPIATFEEPAQETQEHVEETQEPAQEPEHKNAKASLGPIREDPIT